MKNIIGIFTLLSLSIFLTTGCTKTNEDNTADGNKEPSYITMDDFDDDAESAMSEQEEGLLATIYVTDIEAQNLIDKKVSVEAVTPEAIFEELKTAEVITKDTKLNSFKTHTSQEDLQVGVLDVSEDFYNFNLGSGYETMMLNSVAKTYIENFELDMLKLLVDGKDYQSGHIAFGEDDFFTPEYVK